MLSRWARLVKPPCTDLLCHISPFRVVSCVFWGVGSWTQNTIQGVCTGLCVCMFVSEYKAAAGNGLLYLLALCWNHDLKSRSFCEVIPFSTSHLLKWNALKNHDKKKKNNNNNNNAYYNRHFNFTSLSGTFLSPADYSLLRSVNKLKWDPASKGQWVPGNVFLTFAFSLGLNATHFF